MFDQGWHPDPHRRHEFRFWNGQTWTAHVVTGGKAFVDNVEDVYSPGPELPPPTMPQGFWPEPSSTPIQPSNQPAIAAYQPVPYATYHHQTVVVQAKKSVGLAFILTFLFGPLGMFYSTVPGALIMLVLSVVLAFVTFGLSILITWPICMVWGMLACK